MKKIVTALLNENIHNKLLKHKEIEIIKNDIQYKEGIIELLEINNNIDYIIINELLPGEIEIKELIEKIKKINKEIYCIIILENKKEELENFLLSKGKIKILYNNEVTIEDIIKIIVEDNEKEKMKKEIIEIKKLIENNYETYIKEEDKLEEIITEKEIIEIENEIKKEYEENNIINKISNLIKNKNKIIKNKTISILGEEGVRQNNIYNKYCKYLYKK